jgi:hypothetical protein
MTAVRQRWYTLVFDDSTPYFTKSAEESHTTAPRISATMDVFIFAEW